MKKIAFLHAVLIVALLSASWILFLVQMKKPETQDTAPDKQPPVEVISTDSPNFPDQKAPQEKQSLPIGTIQNPASIPPAWAEWIDYLGQKQNAKDMRVAVDAMRKTVFSMESEEGLARLLELIYSGANIKTGLVFQVGKNGELLGAPDLQTLLMDWLSRMDPVQAAVIAKLALEQTGESLGPDLFVIHLRNYAKGSTDSDLQHNQFVRQYFDQLINNPEWTDNPVHSIAESMDFAVYLEDGSLVSALSGFMAGGQSPALGIGPSEIPEYLNRNGLVYNRDGNQLHIAAYERWAEPVANGVERVISLNLAIMLNTENVQTFPWYRSEEPDYGIQVTVIALDANDTQATLVAEWVVQKPKSDQFLIRRLTRLYHDMPAGEVDNVDRRRREPRSNRLQKGWRRPRKRR